MKLAIAVGAIATITAGMVCAEEAKWAPQFTKRNTKAQLAALLPPRAAAEKVSGKSLLRCVATAKGQLTNCVVADEDPQGYGFGEAALKAVLNERIRSKDQDGKSVEGRPVSTYFRFLAPGDANPDWLRMPTESELASVFPVAAMKKGVDGRATIKCGVTTEGFLSDCKVDSEKPEGMGFGAAALQLAPQFRMTPKMRGGKAVASTVIIPVNWAGMEDMTDGPTRYRVILDPPWIAVPSAEDVKQAWPSKSTEKAATASVRCRLTATGDLKICETIAESPKGQGFGRAAEKLAEAKFKVRVNAANTKGIGDYSVDIPFRFRNPSEPDNRAVTRPKWIRALTPESVGLVFPQAATAAGLSQGRGTINCLVELTGNLSDCQVVSEDPTGMGFGDAAVKAVSYMVMNPWSVDGDPLGGLRATLPIRLVLTDPEPAEAPAEPQ